MVLSLGCALVLRLARTPAATPTAERRACESPVRDERTAEFRTEATLPRRQQEQEQWNIGVLGVQPDRFDHEVEFVGAVDLARYAVSHVGLDEQGFGEVIEPVNALRVEVLATRTPHTNDIPSARAGTDDWR